MTTPGVIFSEKTFRAMFPAFANNVQFPTELIEMYFGLAGNYVGNNTYGLMFSSGALLPALNFMTAHLMQIGQQINAGTDSGITVGATIDKISTTIQEMNLKNQWQYWLASTEYGRQLLALLAAKSVGGFNTVGGLGRAGFRY